LLVRSGDETGCVHANSTRGPEMRRLVIADHQRIVREGLKALLADFNSIEVVAEAGDDMEAIRCVEQHQPDILLINLSMPVPDGMSLIQELKERFPATRILAISMHESEEFIMEGLQQGIDGYCLKDCGGSELLTAIERVLAGKTYLSPAIAERVLVSSGNAHAARKGSAQADRRRLPDQENCAISSHQPENGRKTPQQHHQKTRHPHGIATYSLRHREGPDAFKGQGGGLKNGERRCRGMRSSILSRKMIPPSDAPGVISRNAKR